MKIEINEEEVETIGLVEAYISSLRRQGRPIPESINIFGNGKQTYTQTIDKQNWMPSTTLYQFIKSRGVSENRLKKHINHFSQLRNPTDNKFLQYAKDHLIEGATELSLTWKLPISLSQELFNKGIPKERIDFYTSLFLLGRIEREEVEITTSVDRECYKYILTCWNNEITSLDQLSDPAPISKYWKPGHTVITICEGMGYSKQTILEKALKFKESREGLSKHWNRDFISFMGNRKSSPTSNY